ncbi:glycosyltransferase [Streptomyces sp. WI04-05B]|uniref:glycosyltransferase n=1 Tax=Streptomyces TaxID=1883 RepID=UPI0029AEF59F|nr:MULTISPECIES: glycosyltransferase [unclassified Streptomyces]MDX2547088.1 glycosyltransferase [Streptomyces sp. WI04-05B]MDX2589777.1 glycosyltransferase [Streptomyces sp. WI04-05A]MDX3753226.1 glycosyltransferase [Streptomyces sp. AK08-02]
MKALIYTHGSRGDVQPYLALAHALNRVGHTATLVGPRLYEAWVTGHGVRFAPVNDEVVRLQQRPDVRRILLHQEKAGDVHQQERERIFQELFPRVYPVVLREMWEAAEASGADVVVHSHSSRQAVHQIAERLGVPHVFASLYPHFVASRHYPPEVGSFEERADNLERHARAEDAIGQGAVGELFRSWRAEVLGLPPRPGALDHRFRADGSPAPVVLGFSRYVLEPAPDWPDWVHVTGPWVLPTAPEWQPPERLQRFLENGEQPVFVGFGSLLGNDPEHTGRVVVEALRRTGLRAVVVTGWGGIEICDPPDSVLVEREIPYDWLLPRVRAAVHAGGSGTHNAALAARLPQVACPFHKEQAMWAGRLHELGVAPAPLHQRDLTADALADALHTAVTDPGIACATARLAERTAGERGAEDTVRVLEQTAAGRS